MKERESTWCHLSSWLFRWYYTRKLNNRWHYTPFMISS